VWIFPLIVGSILVVLITVFYIGSVVDPLGHLHGLPVAVVNSDRGATAGPRTADIGAQVQSGLSHAPQVADKLGLTDTTLQAAEHSMQRDGYYATVVIPANFSASLLSLYGVKTTGPAPGRPEITILANQRAGNEGVSLATGVLDPALAAASRQIGRQLSAAVPPAASSPSTRPFLANPITVTTIQYQPLPNHSALGLSAYYIALLTLISGFLGGTIVNTSADAALGYGVTEVGPRWTQRRPVPINRWQTLLLKWVISVVLSALTTGLMLIVAVAIFGMDAPHVGLLWLLAWLCAASVAAGTIALFAILGTSAGQLIAIIVFVYGGLASAGGTVPLQALPAFYRWISELEPLRQVLAGTRSILYFNAQASAGLTRAVTLASAGLVFWLIVGVLATMWYDRKGLYRISPDLLGYVHATADAYKARGSGAGQPGAEKPGGQKPDRPADPPPDG
jgi:YhgE/Pip-like protein